MCLYEPPPLLGLPDLSAAAICALPLAISVARWPELLSSFVGLAVGFLMAHFFIIVLHHEYTPSRFYWMDEQASVVPFSLGTIAFELILLGAISFFVRGLWQGNHVRAISYLSLALALLAAAFASILYLVREAHAFERSAAGLFAINAREAADQLIIADCLFPPFGEGVVGYSMLAVLVIAEILVAVAIAGALKREAGRRPAA